MKKLVILMTILILSVGPVSAYDAGGVNIHGFVSQGFLYSDEYNYLATDTEDGSFEYNEMGLNFSKELTDKLRIGVQLFSRDLGDVANNKVTVDWAYADYRQWDWLGLRAGRIKLPIGLYNETRDIDALRTSIVLPQGIYNDFLRDTTIAVNGASLYGDISMGKAGDLEYQMLAGPINIDKDSGLGKYSGSKSQEIIENQYPGVEATATVSGDMKTDTSYVGALRWAMPIEGLKLGFSIMEAGKTETPLSISLDGLAIEGTGVGKAVTQIYSIEYAWNDLILAAEYMNQKIDSTNTLVIGNTIMHNEATIKSESYYLSASYRFVDWFTLGVYYSIFYPDKDDRDGDGQRIDYMAWEKDLALTLRFDINEYWVFKIEGHSMDGIANVLSIDNPENDFSKQHWYYGAAKLSFNF